MVIRTEYRGQCYSMGSSDPLPAGFEIRIGGLNFQATGNGYLSAKLGPPRSPCTRRRDANTRQHGRCGSIGATALSPLRPALASGAVGAPTCSACRRAT
jgi:hypothetical protein